MRFVTYLSGKTRDATFHKNCDSDAASYKLGNKEAKVFFDILESRGSLDDWREETANKLPYVAQDELLDLLSDLEGEEDILQPHIEGIRLVATTEACCGYVHIHSSLITGA